ncbi:M20 family metallopeptidase [Enterovirga sp.]|jgi:succinyl-diaminopimelate desuccinylase|uniref:M20 family metallopeptidase n=1 Tax=Enterovirga sp. TaxID=2026350 RepID=UPI00260C1A1A|nr:M20 family metallopeptidase [Enterovirga sp.]MDB5591877.1 family metallopeptidase [Enterovirga sp.]
MTLSADPVALAQRLVRIPSVNPPGDEAPCADAVAQVLAEFGCVVERYEFAPGRPSLVARLRGTTDQKPLCFTGHVDVVPAGTAPWRYGPFDGVIADGMLHGRGSCDMKSGIAAFLTAAADLAGRAPLRRGLTFVITSGEETGCQGAFDLARRGVLGPAALLVVAEPTSNQPVLAHKGSLRVAVTARGRTAHSAMPEEGENAISKAVDWIGRVQKLRFEASHPLLGRATAAVTTVTGGHAANAVPDLARFTVDFRTLPEDDHPSRLRELRALLGDEAEIEILTDFGGFATPPDSPAIRPLLDLLTGRLGRPPALLGAAYFTDASALVPGFGDVPTVVIGPGASAQCHKTDEQCAVAEIQAAKEIYGELIRRVCL